MICKKRAAEFIEKVIMISKEYGLSISHDDGAFTITQYHESLSDWLKDHNFRDFEYHSRYMNANEVEKAIERAKEGILGTCHY